MGWRAGASSLLAGQNLALNGVLGVPGAAQPQAEGLGGWDILLAPSLTLQPDRWMSPGHTRPGKLITLSSTPVLQGLGWGCWCSSLPTARLGCQQLLLAMATVPSLWLPWAPIPKIAHIVGVPHAQA